MTSIFCSLGRLECLIIFLSMTLFLILMIISIINIYLFLLGGALALNELHFDIMGKREDFIGVMDLNLVILMLVSIILLVNWEYLLFQLSVLYLNYPPLENGKTHHVLLIISLIIFLLCHNAHGLKNQGLWIRN